MEMSYSNITPMNYEKGCKGTTIKRSIQRFVKLYFLNFAVMPEKRKAYRKINLIITLFIKY